MPNDKTFHASQFWPTISRYTSKPTMQSQPKFLRFFKIRTQKSAISGRKKCADWLIK
jgi:hypothetical protein